MKSLMTFFDSKRYLAFKKFQTYYEIRKHYFAEEEEQLQEFDALFQSQSIRYTFCVKETWLEETFESMDGDYLVFYHDLMDEAKQRAFMEATLSFYDYAYGGVSTHAHLEQKIIAQLTEAEEFSYELDTIVYRIGELECYLTVTLFQHGNFAFKIFDKDDYEEQVKEELIAKLERQLVSLFH